MKLVSDFLIDIPLLKYDDPVTHARQILRDDVYREIYVHDGKKKLLGYIDITDVLRITATKSNVTVEGFLHEVIPAHSDDEIEDVVRSMRDGKTDSAPVVDKQQQILGGVLLSELFPVIITRQELNGTVSDSMTKKPVTCSADDTIQKIFGLIVESGFTVFPVMKKRRLVGIISRRDLLREGRLRSALENSGNILVETVMTKQMFTIGPDEPVGSAAKLMATHDISILPVVEDGVLVGVIDRHDVLKGLT